MSMDSLFKSDEKPLISPVINLRKFLMTATSHEERLQKVFETFENREDENLVDSIPYIRDSRDNFRQFMVQRGQTFEEADKIVNGGDDVLATMLENFPVGEYEITFPPKDSKLMTHRVLHTLRQKYKTSAVKNAVVRRGKYFKYREQELRRQYTEPNTRSNKDVLLTVHLLKPMNRAPEPGEIIKFKGKCGVKLLIRGSMPLVRLREKIFCTSDFWSNAEDYNDVSDANFYFHNRFPSNFLFIHDTFYLDMRHPDSKDITESIREFMQRKKQDFGQFHVHDMANVQIIDLKIRLGQPYLFLHQGRCEHLIVFTDLRLLNAGDVQNASDYPIRLYDTIQQKLCCVCYSTVAGLVVTESDRLPMAPAFFCTKCFTSFHYDNGQRIGNFKAYHYLSHAGIE